MPAVTLPNWPPVLSPSQIEALTLEANTFALSHSLLYLPTDFVDPPSYAIHAPYTLLPIPFPRVLFQEAQDLQKLYNILYSRLAMNTVLLDNVMGGEVGVGAVDEFTGALWRGWKSLRDQPPPWPQQVVQFGLFRSDYMLDTSRDDRTGLEVSLKQVEFNTIAASFGALSTIVASLHKHILDVFGYFDASPLLAADNLPPNDTLAHIAAGLAAAHREYGSADACILMVVQPKERNIFDQKLLEYELLEKHGIAVVRLTFEELISKATVDSVSGVLSIDQIGSSGREVAVVYYRAGYSPSDYTSPAHFQVRIQLESSRSIKCPSIPLQLAGGKKMQEYLARPGILESVLGHDNFCSLDLLRLRQSWVQMWSLSADDGLPKVLRQYSDLVLKPQREGGGNNVYHTNIPKFLEQLPEKELPAWIAMQLIRPPTGVFTHVVKGGEPCSIFTAVVSELGVFGWSLFGGEDGQGGMIVEKTAGWLVRTKGRDSDEGGVAVGHSVLDSIILV